MSSSSSPRTTYTYTTSTASMNRSISLRKRPITTGPTPPSLIASPHLSAPMFQRQYTRSAPSYVDHDDLGLMDTVPAGSSIPRSMQAVSPMPSPSERSRSHSYFVAQVSASPHAQPALLRALSAPLPGRVPISSPSSSPVSKKRAVA
ncbi:hypothetical protein BOTBODRAFT_171341 [Botryobasidium botryosum FD-172 SS1]|uniref:Uncharacterized protein n=1 Tax=Botryobasidium botryosum (strain FD-172 SS1) TaxID=930990 RepID=A0A067N416_BOTB1|nr:hypothetical protein BOTBODRAFT_171341 [Botryobasidium botryosum FD-172 SS1]